MSVRLEVLLLLELACTRRLHLGPGLLIVDREDERGDLVVMALPEGPRD